jgi:hypothetical protein
LDGRPGPVTKHNVVIMLPLSPISAGPQANRHCTHRFFDHDRLNIIDASDSIDKLYVYES